MLLSLFGCLNAPRFRLGTPFKSLVKNSSYHFVRNIFAYLAKAFCKAALSVNLAAGTPPCSWIYLAHPRFPRNKAASRGVIRSPLVFRIIPVTSALLSIRTLNIDNVSLRTVFLQQLYDQQKDEIRNPFPSLLSWHIHRTQPIPSLRIDREKSLVNPDLHFRNPLLDQVN